MGTGRSGSGTTRLVRQRVASHPSTNDIDAYGILNSGLKSTQHISGGTGPSDASIAWFEQNMGMSHNDAQQAADVFLFYSRGGDTFMHWNQDDGNGKANNDVVDRVLSDPKSPVFSGEHYRGLFLDDSKFNGNAKKEIQKIIKKGTWKEEGATSFSSSLNTAHNFGGWNSTGFRNGVAVTVIHSGGSGMPMKHLSSYPGENEVIHSRKQMLNGMKILRAEWVSDKQVNIYVEDKKPGKGKKAK